MKQQLFHWHDPFIQSHLSFVFFFQEYLMSGHDIYQDWSWKILYLFFSTLLPKKLFHYQKVMYCWQPLFSLFFILAMHSPKCQQQSREGRKALSWCRQSTFRPFLSLRCNLLSQRSFVSIVRLLAISFFNVSKLHFYLLRFITPL